VTRQEEFRAPKYGRNGIKAQVLIFSLEKVLRSMAERSGLLSMGVETISGPESTGLAGAGIDIILEGGDTGRKMEWVVYETYDLEDGSSRENPELLESDVRQDSGDGHDGAEAAISWQQQRLRPDYRNLPGKTASAELGGGTSCGESSEGSGLGWTCWPWASKPFRITPRTSSSPGILRCFSFMPAKILSPAYSHLALI